MKGPISITSNLQLESFLYRHVEYVDPEYVLKHDNIILMGCSPTHVWFSVTDPKKPEENLYKNVDIPFLFVGQILFSRQLIIMPHSTFNKLADNLGDPDDRDITFVSMSGLLLKWLQL